MVDGVATAVAVGRVRHLQIAGRLDVRRHVGRRGGCGCEMSGARNELRVGVRTSVMTIL